MTSHIANLKIRRRFELADACRGWLRNVLGRSRLYRERARQRRQLAALSHEQLKDMGITAYDAAKEARKPFWQC